MYVVLIWSRILRNVHQVLLWFHAFGALSIHFLLFKTGGGLKFELAIIRGRTILHWAACYSCLGPLPRKGSLFRFLLLTLAHMKCKVRPEEEEEWAIPQIRVKSSTWAPNCGTSHYSKEISSHSFYPRLAIFLIPITHKRFGVVTDVIVSTSILHQNAQENSILVLNLEF